MEDTLKESIARIDFILELIKQRQITGSIKEIKILREGLCSILKEKPDQPLIRKGGLDLPDF